MDRDGAAEDSDGDYRPVEVEEAPEAADENPATVEVEGPVEEEGAAVIVDPTGYTA